MEQFEVCVEEDEVQIGLFRVPVPNYDRRAFREASVNALIHRDYTNLGAVHIRWEDYGISISNPEDFVEGVTLDNLLSHFCDFGERIKVDNKQIRAFEEGKRVDRMSLK
jgi:ATP-dependent DNA helicase RecG